MTKLIICSLLRKNYGFSMIELMISVSLIGILAMIGIPSYSNFRAKAYQAEYTGYLAAIRTAQTSFFTEYGGYHSSFKVLGFAPMGKVYANAIGFNSAGTTTPEAPPTGTYYRIRDMCNGIDAQCEMMIPFDFTHPQVTNINDPTAVVNVTTYKVGIMFADERAGAGGCTLDPSAHGTSILNLWYMDQTSLVSKDVTVVTY